MAKHTGPRYFSSIFLEIRYIRHEALLGPLSEHQKERLATYQDLARQLNEGVHKAYSVWRIVERSDDPEHEVSIPDSPIDAQETIASDYWCCCGLILPWEGNTEMPDDVWFSHPGHLPLDEVKRP